MGDTKIEWADKVWNPITGCSHSGSSGCDHCYARRMAPRLKGRYGYPKDDPFRITFHPEKVEQPIHWRKPSRIFVCSMGDLFHPDVRCEWIDDIWEVMAACKQHTFFVLTKRPENVDRLLYGISSDCVCRELGGGDYLKNVWFGASIEDQPSADDRISKLLQITAAHRWVSIEPMLKSVVLNDGSGGQLLGPCDECGGAETDCPACEGIHGIDWVVLGGETGPKARPMHPDWVRSVRDQCQTAGVPFFFKGWGEWKQIEHVIHGAQNYSTMNPRKLVALDDRTLMEKVGKKKSGRLLDGREWNEMLVK